MNTKIFNNFLVSITIRAIDWIDDTPENTKGFEKIVSGIKQQTSSLYNLLTVFAFSLAVYAIYKTALKFLGNGEKRTEAKKEFPAIFLIIMLLIGMFTFFGIAKNLGEKLF